MSPRRQFRARVPRGPYGTPEAIARALEALATDMYDLQDALAALNNSLDDQVPSDDIRARITISSGAFQVVGTLPGSTAITGTDLAITWSPPLVGENVVRARSVEPGAYELYWIQAHDNARTVLQATDLAGVTVDLSVGSHAVVVEVGEL